MSKVFFYNADISLRLKNKRNLKLAIQELFKNEGCSLERLNYVFCSDPYLLEINRKYLRHDTLTDVISFNLSQKNEPIRGEIYISVDRVKDNARVHQVSRLNEYLRVIIHGALHLCGHDDKRKKAKMEMRARENFYLRRFEVSREIM